MDQSTRLLQALFFLKKPELGTLWWISNQLWKQNSTFVLKDEQKDGSHPGVSILKNQTGLPQFIPMLLGTSNKNFQALRFKMDDQKKRITYFGTLRPVDCALACFSSNMIKNNAPKSKLNEKDCTALENFIRRKFQ